MSSLASEDTLQSGGALTPRQIEEQWRERITQAKAARRPFIPIWLLNLAFAAGQHWVAWDKRAQRVRALRELDPKYADRELFTADRITEYRLAQLGELDSDDDRPQLIAVQEGDNAEAATEQLNRAVAYAWEHEWGAQDALEQARRYVVDLGTAAIRCRWEPNKGPIKGHAVYRQSGEPVTHPLELAHLAAHGALPDGTLPRIRQVKEGRSCWEAYSSFGILAQPGVNHEDQFTWEILVRPVPIDELKAQYGAAATGLQADPDVASAMGLTTSEIVPDNRSQGIGPNRLRGHVWVYTCFQRPNSHYPKGAVAVIASNEYKLLDFTEELPYQTPDGEPHSGIVYLHWDRKNDRFYSRAWIEPLKDPQRLINRRKTQNTEIIDRAMPRHYVKQGDMPEAPTGAPMEVVELGRNAEAPVFWQGSGPGNWMYEDITALLDDLGHASTMSAIRLGENPQGVDTYSTLAQLNDNEVSKRAVIIRDHRKQIARLVELSIGDMQKYWPDEKQILVAGDEDQIARAVFSKGIIPTFYMAKVATGAPEPRSQGALLKQLDAIWAAAVQSWVAVQDGPTWIGWYASSMAAGKPLDLPTLKANTQHDLAYLENKIMLAGQLPPVSDYDNLQVHLPIHREAQDQARAQGDQQTLALLIQHIQQHQQMAQANVAQANAIAAGQNPVGPSPVQLPNPREPYPNRIPGEFSQLAEGQ